jgi:hypothetical protein
MRLTTTSFRVDGFPGITIDNGRTSLKNVGDIPLSGITIMKY